MEHYLGEKLKKLRESRGWTQADLAKRLNKAVSTVSGYESDINEQEAEIVRLIFDKYVYEGYGAQRIATYLNNAGYRARSGKCWHPGSLRGMVGNLTYMGVLRCGDARSELMPELQIIPQEEFEAAQRIREDRSAHAAEEAEHHVPLRTRGQALLSNNVYCGHCGARLALTTSRKWRKLSDGTLDDTLRIRYTCYGKLRKQTDCTGQTGYTMHILDEIRALGEEAQPERDVQNADFSATAENQQRRRAKGMCGCCTFSLSRTGRFHQNL